MLFAPHLFMLIGDVLLFSMLGLCRNWDSLQNSRYNFFKPFPYPTFFFLLLLILNIFNCYILQDFKIQNIVGSCDVKFPIRLEGLAYSHAAFSSVSDLNLYI
jgi:hypothetical protein